MKLFLIRQDVNLGYDTYDAAVVAAADEDEARHMHPGGEREGENEEWRLNETWVTYLGEAAPGIDKGVVWCVIDFRLR